MSINVKNEARGRFNDLLKVWSRGPKGFPWRAEMKSISGKRVKCNSVLYVKEQLLADPWLNVLYFLYCWGTRAVWCLFILKVLKLEILYKAKHHLAGQTDPLLGPRLANGHHKEFDGFFANSLLSIHSLSICWSHPLLTSDFFTNCVLFSSIICWTLIKLIPL